MLIKRVFLGFVTIGFLVFAALEGWHRFRYGHFAALGLHTDIVVADSDIGAKDMYVARVWNLSWKSIEVEGCKLPGGFAGSGVLHHWDIQRWDSKRHDWSSLQGANTWLPQPFASPVDGDTWSKCGGETTRIFPLSHHNLAWVYKDWVMKTDTIRMAIHTSVKLPVDRQRIIYTQAFSVQ